MSDFLSQPIDHASNIHTDIAALKELSDEISLELYGSGNLTTDGGDGNSSGREGYVFGRKARVGPAACKE